LKDVRQVLNVNHCPLMPSIISCQGRR